MVAATQVVQETQTCAVLVAEVREEQELLPLPRLVELAVLVLHQPFLDLPSLTPEAEEAVVRALVALPERVVLVQVLARLL